MGGLYPSYDRFLYCHTRQMVWCAALEVPPLLKVTQWHVHLKDFTEDCDRVRKLLELTRLPTSRQGECWLGSPLCATIEGYMKDVHVKANMASLGIKCLLKECPRFVTPLNMLLEIHVDELEMR